MIKIKHTKTIPVVKNLIGGNAIPTLVTDAELVLVEKEFGNLEEGYIKIGKYKPKWVKPILISRTERPELL